MAMESYLSSNFPHLPESSHPETSPVKETQAVFKAVFKALKLSVSNPGPGVYMYAYHSMQSSADFFRNPPEAGDSPAQAAKRCQASYSH
ncbi:TPA: hypothetical protein HA351_16250 [Methanosarcinaceae archaeon]|nr:hypothetical protein [Methanosarcinaceae archaeon]